MIRLHPSGRTVECDSGRTVLEALERMKRARLVPFDVPGHKRGRGNPELRDFLGATCLDVDVNSMKPLDNLCHPTGVIKQAEALAAEAFGAAHPDFVPEDAGALLAQLKVENAASLCAGGESGQRYLRLWPHQHETDGFFAAVWVKKA